ncbi:MAG: peptide-methionine (R)-S-oxide reductase [Calditrichaeota bacterium]|nr:MAG: peptide-methionine (R)-S-oxide reductase [Calditrichota bacterium]MBL1207832.1 peptide-methionine (R)-S-oxide reductase [Calditrichota bacterium]NOG47666.1 peptide-methionine (R)-S-oxide reductase MsrB [Calditrichota bacterium]
MAKIKKTEEEWRESLTEEQYRILREKGTERPFSGDYVDNKIQGMYVCAGCGNELFQSETKFDSGSGWPSFYKPFSEQSTEESADSSHGMQRVEVMCNKCGGHLGHVFPDGPQPSGLRYCINSESLNFKKKK